MLRNILLLSVLMLFASSVDAQKKRTKKKKKKDNVEIIEFEDDSSSRSSRKRDSRKKDSDFSGIILKTNPLSNIVGWQFVEVEYPVFEWLSAQAGLGLTFEPVIASASQSYLAALFQTSQESTNWEAGRDVFDDYSDLSIRESSLGFYGSASARLYFYDDAPDGSFVSLKARLSTRNWEVQKIAEGASSLTRLPDELEDESVRNFDFMIGYGYQELYSRLTVSYFGGLGYRVINETRQDIGQDDSNRFYNATQKISRNTIRYEFGVRLGYQL